VRTDFLTYYRYVRWLAILSAPQTGESEDRSFNILLYWYDRRLAILSAPQKDESEDRSFNILLTKDIFTLCSLFFSVWEKFFPAILQKNGIYVCCFPNPRLPSPFLAKVPSY
jgi:hypothetical protein